MKNLHEKFVEYGGKAKKWQRKCLFLLPKIFEKRIYNKKGFSSIYEYAAKIAGLSHNQVEEALRVLKRISDKPALMRIAEKKGINAVRPVATIATKETAAFWAEKSKQMPNRTLRLYVKEFRGISGDIPEKEILELRLNTALIERLKKRKGDKTWGELIEELLAGEEKPRPVKTKSKHIPNAIKKYVQKRCGGFCEFPSCKKEYLHLHHSNRHASDHIHDPDKIIALCKEHHDLAHQGLIHNEEAAPQNWSILKNPDRTNLNCHIDQKVQFYQRC